ncbi:MAG: hypothetical protein R3B69_00080 [Candidatus Paceibacterota bacterium]
MGTETGGLLMSTDNPFSGHRIPDRKDMAVKRFKDVAIGEVFRWRGISFTKTEPDADGINAVRTNNEKVRMQFADRMEVTVEVAPTSTTLQ